jgi:hypothetical protein
MTEARRLLVCDDDQESRRRIWAARAVAVGADLLQWVLLPMFLAGGLEPTTVALDVVVGGVLTWLCGWHVAFLPTAAVELLPAVDLFPTWTAAVWFVLRTRR